MRALPGQASRVTRDAPPATVTRSSAHEDQRRRILHSLAELVAERGYADVTGEQIVKRAHVSFKTFYKHFADKEDCFAALFDEFFASTKSDIETRLAGERRPWADQVAVALRALFETIAADPVTARAVIVEAPTVGPGLRARCEKATKAFAPLFRAGREVSPRGSELPESIEDTLSGAVFWTVYEHLVVRSADDLIDYLPVLLELVLRTYLGQAEASRIARADAPVSPSRPLPDERSLELGPLPGGHHGLTREQIADSQRERLLAAMAHEVSERGYRATTITGVVKFASVSTRDFYEHFEGKEACFLAAFEAVRDHLSDVISAAVAEESDWPQQVIAGLRAALEFFAGEPELARLCLLEPLSATPRIAVAFREAVLAGVPALSLGRAELADPDSLLPEAESSVIGGAVWMATRQIVSGDPEKLPGLLPDLVDFTLAQYLGPERAGALARESLRRLVRPR